jgi:hypothetical protein
MVYLEKSAVRASVAAGSMYITLPSLVSFEKQKTVAPVFCATVYVPPGALAEVDRIILCPLCHVAALPNAVENCTMTPFIVISEELRAPGTVSKVQLIPSVLR